MQSEVTGDAGETPAGRVYCSFGQPFRGLTWDLVGIQGTPADIARDQGPSADVHRLSMGAE